MCGLVGIAGKLEYADEETMRRLLVLDYWRGKDSTGIAAVRHGDKSFHVAKLASHPFDLFDMGKFKSALSAHASQAFIGHNRAATKGMITTFNAHPYVFDDIVGAHNGTLSVASHKDLEDAVGEKFAVDSQAVIKAISVLGLEETVKLMQGAWALTFYDATDDSLNFIRNDQRPLWYAYSKEHNKLFWASEYQMIDEACRHSKTELSPLTNERGTFKFFATEIDVHYRFDLAALRAGSEERPKPKVKEIKGKEAPVVTSTVAWEDPFPHGPHSYYKASANSKTTSGTTTSTPGKNGIKKRLEPSVADTIIGLVGSPTDPYAGMIKRDDFEYMTKFGCSWCQASVKWGDVGITIYDRDQICLCSDCSRKSVDNQNRIYVPNITRFQ